MRIPVPLARRLASVLASTTSVSRASVELPVQKVADAARVSSVARSSVLGFVSKALVYGESTSQVPTVTGVERGELSEGGVGTSD